MRRPVLAIAFALILTVAPAVAEDGAIHPRFEWHLCLEQSFERATEGLYEFEVRGVHTDPRGPQRFPIVPGMVLADTLNPAHYQPMLVVRVEQTAGSANPYPGETFALKVYAICLQPNARPPEFGAVFQPVARLGDGPLARAIVAAAGSPDEHITAVTRLHLRQEIDSYFDLRELKQTYTPTTEPICVTRAREGEFADCYSFLACARAVAAPVSSSTPSAPDSP